MHSKEENRFCFVTEDDKHEYIRFPEQKATAEEQGEKIPDKVLDVVLDLAEMQAKGLTTWNDKDHDEVL